ncbi:MAG TPA: helix-hairpin-helix domain-containing protein [Acidobacteriota bacterium]|nr:helix-hairpin-helix domain-containing protein [Acidobacteriota bacterium]HQQ46575.1 helix-hairpin-helix domain-containing protein [Acidobacteriota bacterium]
MAQGKKTPQKGGLRTIPGVGPSIEKDLQELGYFSIAALEGGDPQKMYEKSCRIAGKKIDRCLLYVYRCAVTYAGMKEGKRENLKWWDFKDGK